jgi:hypothetical protein
MTKVLKVGDRFKCPHLAIHWKEFWERTQGPLIDDVFYVIRELNEDLQYSNRPGGGGPYINSRTTVGITILEETEQMTIDGMIAVLRAYKEGKPIEYRPSSLGQWVCTMKPNWDFNGTEYRVAQIPDSINWDHVNPKFKYMARDKSNTAYLYKAKPKFTYRAWSCSEGDLSGIEAFASYKQGTVPWDKSLVERS